MKKQTIQTPEKKVFDTYKIEYCDKYFAKLVSVGSNFFIYEKCSLLPNNICNGDVVTKYYNKLTKIYSYEITRKTQLPSAKNTKQLNLFYKNKNKYILLENNGKKYIQNIALFDNTCVVFENNAEFEQDKLSTQIVLDFIKQKNIKKIKNFHISKWVICCIYNHTICLYNLFDFNDKRYISDTLLEQNAQKGDIYYFVEIGKFCEYIFDKFCEEMLFAKYANLFSEIDKNAIEQKPSQAEKIIMQKFDKKNSKLFAKKYNYDFVARWCVAEKQSENSLGVIYRLENSEGTSICVSQSELPAFARPGDFVGVICNGEYVFDRVGLLKHLEDMEQMAKNANGDIWYTNLTYCKNIKTLCTYNITKKHFKHSKTHDDKPL